MNGGYVLVDCDSLELTSQTEVTIDGIYERVKKAYSTNKPIYAVNCEWYDESMSPIAVMITKTGDTYTATASILQLVIASDDGVTINSLIS